MSFVILLPRLSSLFLLRPIGNEPVFIRSCEVSASGSRLSATVSMEHLFAVFDSDYLRRLLSVDVRVFSFLHNLFHLQLSDVVISLRIDLLLRQ